MPVKSSGALSFSDIRAEFGGSGAISLSQYYRGGGRVPLFEDVNASVPTSGQISFNQFYSSLNGFVFQQTISGNIQNYHLRNAAISWGWNQSLPLFAKVTINGGAWVTASSTGIYAFDTGDSYPAYSRLILVNHGYIVGMGGNGGQGAGSSWGSAIGGSGGGWGGPAFGARVGITVWNYGIIAGGGGGGGGGQSGTYAYSDKYSTYYYAFSGGGGGGGRSGLTNAGGGSNGSAQGNYAYHGGWGGTGTLNGQGGGGAGGYLNGNLRGGPGGAGGGWGENGGPGGDRWHPQNLTSGVAGPYGAGGGGYALHWSWNISWGNWGTVIGGIG